MEGNKFIAALGGAIGALCATAIAAAASASANEALVSGGRSSGSTIAERALAVHNAERERLQLPGLRWNRKLESEAEQWARHISKLGMLQHASQPVRNNAGENLWMGSAGNWPVEVMVGTFVEEKRHYRHDSFPNISQTGNWADVGHYTQVIWRDTQEVGCALVTDRGHDVLVCRYWPAGNIWGRKAY